MENLLLKSVERMEREITIETEIVKTASIDRAAVDKKKVGKIWAFLSPYFNLPEWEAEYEKERAHFTLKGSENAYYNRIEITYRKNWYFREREDDVIEYEKMEISFSSASGDAEKDRDVFKRVIAQGQIAQIVLTHGKEMVEGLNRIHKEVMMEEAKWATIYNQSEKRIRELEQEIERIQMVRLMEKLKTTGVEFKEKKDRHGDEHWPELVIKTRHSFDRVSKLKAVRVTPTGKMMELEIHWLSHNWCVEGHREYAEIKNKHNRMVRTEKVMEFMRKYKSQIKHSDES